jgi:hypothetical protein
MTELRCKSRCVQLGGCPSWFVLLILLWCARNWHRALGKEPSKNIFGVENCFAFSVVLLDTARVRVVGAPGLLYLLQ